MDKKETRSSEARDYLKTIIKPSDTIAIIITHTAQSGMSRRMKVYTKDFRNITGWIAELCDLSMNENGLRIIGCGMDMTFWLANDITKCLYGNKKPKGLKGNGGGCLNWVAIY